MWSAIFAEIGDLVILLVILWALYFIFRLFKRWWFDDKPKADKVAGEGNKTDNPAEPR